MKTQGRKRKVTWRQNPNAQQTEDPSARADPPTPQGDPPTPKGEQTAPGDDELAFERTLREDALTSAMIRVCQRIAGTQPGPAS